jgi:hypothetical protein
MSIWDNFGNSLVAMQYGGMPQFGSLGPLGGKVAPHKSLRYGDSTVEETLAAKNGNGIDPTDSANADMLRKMRNQSWLQLGAGMMRNNTANPVAAFGQSLSDMQGSGMDNAYKGALTRNLFDEGAERERQRQERANRKRTFGNWALLNKGKDPRADAYLQGMLNEDQLSELHEQQFSAPKETDRIQNYRYYANEEMKAGRPPLSMFEWEKALKAGTTVNVNNVTADERRGSVMLQSAKNDFNVAMQNFDALTDEQSQLGGAIEQAGGGAIGRWMQSPEYQVATDAVTSVLMMHAYITTGATMQREEAAQKAQLMLPQIGDDPRRLTAKKQRLTEYMRAIELSAGDAAGAVSSGTNEFNWDPQNGLTPR